MPLEVRDSPAPALGTLKFRGHCWNLSTSWTVSILEKMSKSSWRQIEKMLLMPLYSDLADWTGRFTLVLQIRCGVSASSRSTQEKCHLKRISDLTCWHPNRLVLLLPRSDAFAPRLEFLQFEMDKKL